MGEAGTGAPESRCRKQGAVHGIACDGAASRVRCTLKPAWCRNHGAVHGLVCKGAARRSVTGLALRTASDE